MHVGLSEFHKTIFECGFIKEFNKTINFYVGL